MSRLVTVKKKYHRNKMCSEILAKYCYSKLNKRPVLYVKNKQNIYPYTPKTWQNYFKLRKCKWPTHLSTVEWVYNFWSTVQQWKRMKISFDIIRRVERRLKTCSMRPTVLHYLNQGFFSAFIVRSKNYIRPNIREHTCLCLYTIGMFVCVNIYVFVSVSHTYTFTQRPPILLYSITEWSYMRS